jgi:hypothetical protein
MAQENEAETERSEGISRLLQLTLRRGSHWATKVAKLY